MEVILHPEVDTDLVDAMEYYSREASPKLAVEFYSEFRRCANLIELRAISFSVLRRSAQTAQLSSFSLSHFIRSYFGRIGPDRNRKTRPQASVVRD